MKFPTRYGLLSILALVPFLTSNALQDVVAADKEEGEVEAKVAIEHVVEEFSRCIMEKDWEAFELLFVDEDTPWIGVIESSKREKAEKMGLLDESGLYRVSRQQFQKQIEADPKTSEEHFMNLVVDLHDGLASVRADYDFLRDGEVLNHGVETWNLVETKGGWKIVSVLYSIHRGER